MSGAALSSQRAEPHPNLDPPATEPSSVRTNLILGSISCAVTAVFATLLALIIVNGLALSSSCTITALQLGITNSALGGTALLAFVPASYKFTKASYNEGKYQQKTRDVLTRNLRITTGIIALSLAALIAINILGTQGIGLSSAAEMAKWSLVLYPGIAYGGCIIAKCCLAPGTARIKNADPAVQREQREAQAAARKARVRS